MQEAITKKQALRFIHEITLAMTGEEDLEAVLDRILSSCMEATSADSGSIMLMDSSKETLEIVVSRGLKMRPRSFRLKTGEGVTGWVAKNGRGRLIGDSSAEKDYVRLQEGLYSELAVPMLVKEDVIGVISVDSGSKFAFSEDHQDFLQIMANLAAKIFLNLRETNLLKTRDRFHQVMYEISRVVSGSLKLGEVFKEIMAITEKAFRLHRSSLLLYDREEDVLRLEVSVGSNDEDVSSIRYQPGEGITGRVYLNKKPEFIASVQDDPEFLNRMKIDTGQDELGFFCCPIFSGSDVVGVFTTFTRHQEKSDPGSLIEFLEIVGSIVSQSITIQKLFREETREITHENIQLKRELGARYQFGSLVGRSPSMLRLFDKVRIVADSRASVLITGESGTGKELIASAIHYNSPRRDNPFVKVNCAAIPENLLESELFGHRKGAFTGAVADKKGKFESADGGTIFLDEIGELDFNLQSKLLRVLQEREIEPVGGRARSVDIRVIAATNADLEESIAQKKFRADLYYRLNVINLKIPPLRERREDIFPLVQHFMEKYAAENEKNVRGMAPEAVRLLENYEWPGNVRQLENIIERTVVLHQGDFLTVDDFMDSTLPFAEAGQERVEAEVVPAGSVPATREKSWSAAYLPAEDRMTDLEGRVYEAVISEVERRLIHYALKRFRYTKTQAARFLGINRNTLDKKIKDLKIEY